MPVYDERAGALLDRFKEAQDVFIQRTNAANAAASREDFFEKVELMMAANNELMRIYTAMQPYRLDT